MIKINKDPIRSIREPPSGALLVQATSDYPRMCLELRSALQEGRPLTIMVQSPLVCDWVDNVKKCYPEIIIIECDPLQELREHFRTTSLPPDLPPQAVNELRVLELPRPSEPVGDVKSHILSQLVGECYGFRIPDPGWQHLVDLASWYLTEASCSGHHRLIEKWMIERREQWIGKGETYLQKAYRWLLDDSHLRARLLLCRQILLSYGDSQQEDWIRAILDCDHFVPEYIPIRQLPLISREKSLVAELSKRAKTYWRHQITHDTRIEDVLSKMSGELLGELEAVVGELKRKPGKCNRPLVLQLAHQFSSIEGAARLLVQIEALIPPVPKAQRPELTWGWDEWSLWATQQYLPYRKWMQDINQQDVEIDDHAILYGDWLYKSYPVLKNESPTPLVFNAAARIRELVDQGYVVLWLVIDNLPWMHGFLLVQEMNKLGLMPLANPVPKVSMLPSVTELSKRAILGGRLPRDLDPDTDYNQLLWAKWEGTSFRYACNERSLDELISKDAKIYVHQYDGLDHASHRHETYRESDQRNRIRSLCKSTADAVQALRARFEQVMVVIDSDHGSTILPQRTRRLRKPEAALDDPAKHRRCVVLRKDVQLSEADWYTLRPEQFGLSSTFAVARGYGYVERKPQFYTHGGLTPEETVVPHIELQLGHAPEWKPLEVIYEGQSTRPGRTQEATFSIRNLNQTRLSDVRLLIQRVETQPIEVDAEEQGQIENVLINVPTTVREQEFIIRAYITYLAYGRHSSQEVSIRIPIRLIAIDTGIDEIFEE